MRRMRGKVSVLFLMVFPLVLGASVGIFKWMEGRKGSSVAVGTAIPGRKVASASKPAAARAESDEDAEAQKLAAARRQEIEKNLVSFGPADSAKTCGSFEYFGKGESHPSPGHADWDQIMKAFRSAKADLGKFLIRHRWNMTDATREALEVRVRELRIQRPPTLEEPDLAWRGIGTLTRDQEGKPLVRLGAGFPKLFKERPARARFELARLVAQVWSPCELAAAKVESPWNPLLQCLKLGSALGCGAGQYSEAAWAVSTVVARQVASPGCEIPAFQGEANVAALGCANSIPFPLNARRADPSPAVAALQTPGGAL